QGVAPSLVFANPPLPRIVQQCQRGNFAIRRSTKQWYPNLSNASTHSVISTMLMICNASRVNDSCRSMPLTSITDRNQLVRRRNILRIKLQSGRRRHSTSSTLQQGSSQHGERVASGQGAAHQCVDRQPYVSKGYSDVNAAGAYHRIVTQITW